MDGALTPSAFLDFSTEFDNISNGNSGSRRSSSGRRISGGILGRVAQFESLALQSPARPITPPNQNVSGYFPPTPIDTPHERMIKQEQMNQRFLDSYDTSMEETIKPKSNQRARGVFEDMRREAEMHQIPTPPHAPMIQMPTQLDSAPMPTGNFMNMSTLDQEFLKNEQAYDNQQQYSPIAADLSPAVSYNSSPEISERTLKITPFGNNSSLDGHSMTYPEPQSASTVPESPFSRSPRRSESACGINIDETITDTGITIDDIATFIQGPDLVDSKWMCLYPECGKRFGRKENIKSHVQTHLGDRQFQCPHCKKCFVRQHDLKRHAKIHSGVKPYPCQCGNSFARHDALTRHRQRGMCIGAFEGVVKKTVKRGRPRKSRPDDEQRLKKASRTRSKNKAMSSSSSSSGRSDSTSANSPQSDIELLDNALFGDSRTHYLESSPMEGDHFKFTPHHSRVHEEYVSPNATQNPSSPPAQSNYSQHSRHNSISEHLPSSPKSPAISQHSQYQSPPGLCESSSSPAPSHYYDLEVASNHGDTMNSLSLSNISEHDDEMFLEAFAAANTNNLSQLERNPDLLLSKFDDSFSGENNEDLFKVEADTFFGSP
ncbi:hypothetical protein BJ875DRAFT_372953 [Amylocarpus encephaloides]|uniref:C2H2-type domain-containing protein n=1 Tax=Amylocarpus encephaloides TaxID=45428 RepID=A0A9P7YLJ4_9HELO|nr:hypothetical protein BJ875DRAFT_372953 [Amylocarpus encephaloides]